MNSISKYSSQPQLSALGAMAVVLFLILGISASFWGLSHAISHALVSSNSAAAHSAGSFLATVLRCFLL